MVMDIMKMTDDLLEWVKDDMYVSPEKEVRCTDRWCTWSGKAKECDVVLGDMEFLDIVCPNCHSFVDWKDE